MTVELAHAHSVQKPWGVVDPRPWSKAGDDANTIGEIWYQRPGSAAVDAFASAQAIVHQPAAFHPGSSGRCARPVNRTAERQNRSLVRPECRSGSQGRARPKTASHCAAIASGRGRRLDLGPCRVAGGAARRCDFRPRRHDPRDWRGTCHRGNPAAQRHDIPSFRSRSGA